MISKREIKDAIEELEKSSTSYNDCAKLATFYILQDHLFPEDQNDQIEKYIGVHGNSEFLTAVAGCDAEKIWAVIDDLMKTLRQVQPRLYDGILTRIAQSKN